ncbi:MAG: conjugal transfer protein TraN [Gemmataceae bacterium]|nr:conjugal transfer protein TraN [Gemmataceae bacterium]
MWLPSSKLVTAFLLAEILLIEPPLLHAGGYDAGQQTGQDLLNRFGTPEALQQNLPQVPNYSPAARDQNLANPYYTEDPNASGNRTRLGQDVGTQAGTDQAAQTIRSRAISPFSWTFGSASSLVAGMKLNLPTGGSMEAGCRPVAFCAEPGGTIATQTCQVSQSVEQVACHETTTIQDAPGGGQQDVLTDGCAPFKQPPWWPWTDICLDDPGRPRCVNYVRITPQSGILCTDHFIYMRIAQDAPDRVLFQVLDTGTTGFSSPHNDCDSGGNFENWHTLSQVPLDAFNLAPSFTLTASGVGCDPTATRTLTAIGEQALLITCPAPTIQTVTLNWTIPVQTEACHDCWDRERTFGNSTVTSSTCGPLEAQGCNPSGQRCMTEDCTTAERTFTCYSSAACGRWQDQLVCSACIPDPPGPARCVDESYPANGDFLIAAAAMEGQVTMATDHTAAVQVFPGEREGCTSNPLVDCCDAGADQANDIRLAIDAAQYAMSAVRLGEIALIASQFIAEGAPMLSTVANVAMDALTDALGSLISMSWSTVFLVISVAIMLLQFFLQCSEDSIRASTKKNLRLCHEVGDYCSVDLFLFCGETMTTHCCFSTLLARIIQEQGRAQLGIGWGHPEQPNCGGLTVEQLQAIDFTQIDLSEYIADLQRRMVWPTAEETQTRQGQITAVDYQGRAATTIADAGSLAPRITTAISPPGGYEGGATPSITLSVSVIGSGTITVSTGGSCAGGTCAIPVPTGTPVILTPSPTAGWSFGAWTGPCQGAGDCTLTLAAQAAVTATFIQEQYQLAVSVAGTGRVTSNPAGINCSTGSCTALYANGTAVTLTATPGAGWQLYNWGGDCEGAGGCSVQMTQTRSVSTLFRNTPTITAFTADTTFPAPAGSMITWTTTTSGGVPPIQFEYTREDGGASAVVQGYSALSTYTWVTGPGDVGTHRLQVGVRNSGSSAQYEDWRISVPFTILPPVLVTGVVPGSASRGTSVTVTITGQSFRAGDTVTVSGVGVAVSGVSILGGSQIQATFIIDAAAVLGARDVMVMDPAGALATGAGLFTIIGP